MTSFYIPKGLTVKEVDGTPSKIVSTLIVPNTSMTVSGANATVSFPVITSGTAAPSGGNDGDIYLQYTP